MKRIKGLKKTGKKNINTPELWDTYYHTKDELLNFHRNKNIT